MKHVSFYKKYYPRPQFVRDSFISYDGEYDFKFDDNNVGEKEQWYLKPIKDKKILVPFAYQTPKSGINDQKDHIVVWYQKEIELFSLNDDEEQLLVFEGSDYYTKIWVDGIYVGEHKGGYSRFYVSLNNLKHTLKGKKSALMTLRIEDDLSATRIRGKQSWTGSPFGCWYTPTTGLYKTLWSEKVNYTRINHFKVTPNEDNYTFDFDFELLNPSKGLELEIKVTCMDKLISKTRVMAEVSELKVIVDASVQFDGFKHKYWTVDDPSLYEFEITLINNDKIYDKVYSYAGFRIFKTEGNLFILNQNPVYLRLVLEQGYWKDSGLTAPSFDDLEKEIKLIKDLGFNGLRMHQKIEDERFIYLADVYGLFVWCEMPSAYEYRDSLIVEATREWNEIVRNHYNHPSVIVWVPTNESWGVPYIRTNPAQQALATTLYNLTKAYDTMRPVISNDGWEHTTSDIITLHNYEQDPEKFNEFYKDMDAVMNGDNISDYNQTRKAFANGYKYNGEPIMMDEFIGTAFDSTKETGWGYGMAVKNEEEYVERLRGLIKAIVRNNKFAGFCFTQISDVYQEMNGMVDFDRNPKVDIKILREIITQK